MCVWWCKDSSYIWEKNISSLPGIHMSQTFLRSWLSWTSLDGPTVARYLENLSDINSARDQLLVCSESLSLSHPKVNQFGNEGVQKGGGRFNVKPAQVIKSIHLCATCTTVWISTSLQTATEALQKPSKVKFPSFGELLACTCLKGSLFTLVNWLWGWKKKHWLNAVKKMWCLTFVAVMLWNQWGWYIWPELSTVMTRATIPPWRRECRTRVP